MAKANVIDGIRIAQHIASKYRAKYAPRFNYDDILSFGYTGVARALNNFKPNNGRKWSSYVYMAILASIIDELRKFDHLRRTHRSEVNRGDADNIELHSINKHILFIKNNQSTEFEDAVNRMEAREVWHLIKQKLSYRQRVVVEQRFFHKLTFKEIGYQFCISYQRVEQIYRESMAKLRRIAKRFN